MPLLATGTITFLFTDLEGSTKLWEAYPALMPGVIARHDALMRHAVEANGGQIFKTTGDGLDAAFARASDALSAALDAQMALMTEPWPVETPLRSRIGLHTGLAELREGDYFGATLNRTARLMAAGHGGQILLSDATHELCRDSLPPDVSLLPLGGHRLKDLARPETIYQARHPALPADFPPLRTLDATLNNLPQQMTSFIGREKQLEDIKAFLSRTRLLTLTGPGGTGKTRLSLQVAADALHRYSDGAWLVELAALSDPTLVPQTVANVLGLREQPGQSLTETLTEYLKSKRLLLLLDNCEHLVQACAILVAALVRTCPNVTILATSREALGIGGEQTYSIPTLTLPDPKRAKSATVGSVSQYEAVRLFVDRAQFVKSDFAVTNANAPALAQLCYRLDGIPLALELAAARIRSLPVEQINDKLNSRFRLLTGGDRSALPRQQTLRALIDWSYDLLTDGEKTLLARLSIFSGGWTLEAAESVCGWEPLEDWETLDLLTSLTDKSLLLTEDDGGTNRYRMLETVREYATERLSAGNEMPEIRTRHIAFFVALAEEAAPKLTGPEQVPWMNRLEVEHDNLRTALEICADSVGSLPAESALSGLRLSGALWQFWLVRGYLTDGRKHLDRALTVQKAAPSETAGGPEVKKAVAFALGAAGTLSMGQGDYGAALRLFEESLNLYREIGEKSGIALTLMNLGNIALHQGDLMSARSQITESLGLLRESDDKRGVALTLMNLGYIALHQGDLALAQSRNKECLNLYREMGHKRGITYALINFGILAFNRGDFALARSHYAESLGLLRQIGDKSGFSYFMEGMAAVCNGEGNPRLSVVLTASAASLRESIGVPLPSIDQATLDAEIIKARESLSPSAFDAAWAEGAATPWEQAVALALGENQSGD